MPRTKVQKQTSKRNRNSDEDGLRLQLKELQRIYDESENEAAMIWKQRREMIVDMFRNFRFNLSSIEMGKTIGEVVNEAKAAADSLLTEVSEASKIDDDGTYTFVVWMLNVYTNDKRISIYDSLTNEIHLLCDVKA